MKRGLPGPGVGEYHILVLIIALLKPKFICLKLISGRLGGYTSVGLGGITILLFLYLLLLPKFNGRSLEVRLFLYEANCEAEAT
jgi:hypothetical protein